MNQVVKAGVRRDHGQGIAAEADACWQVGAGIAGGYTRNFVAECLRGQTCGIASVHVAGTLQQIDGVGGCTFRRCGSQGCFDGGYFVDIQDRNVNLFFSYEGCVGAHVRRDHGEAVAGLRFEVGAVFNCYDARAADLQQSRLACERFEAVGHASVVGGDVLIGRRRRVNNSRHGCVLCHGALAAALEDGGVVVAVDCDLEGARCGRLGAQVPVGLLGGDAVDAVG